jgi:hypothetical protein
VQHCGIGERELAKILFGDEALLNASGMTSAKSGDELAPGSTIGIAGSGTTAILV